MSGISDRLYRSSKRSRYQSDPVLDNPQIKYIHRLCMQFVYASSGLLLFLVLCFIFFTQAGLRTEITLADHQHSPLYYPNKFVPLASEKDSINHLPSECDLFSGRWVHDPSYPLYKLNSCPVIEQGFRCGENGRTDHRYMEWRWQPHNCNLPRFNAKDMLINMQNRRIAFVGDSLGRTQWQSLICMLLEGILDKNSVYEINENQITKLAPYLAYYFSSYNLTVEYHRSPFLVQQGLPPKRVPRRVRSTLKLDKLEIVEFKWRDADVLIFNTGHWWNPSKTYKIGCYFQVGNFLRLGMKIEAAYQLALKTWASWVEDRVNVNKTQVFFRSFEAVHDEVVQAARRCHVQFDPDFDTAHRKFYSKAVLLQEVLASMKIPVLILNVTGLTEYRVDGHVSNWTGGPTPVDCSHWCLPGVPDTWNELLYASLLLKGGATWSMPK